jgi:hypothetical protein
MKETFSNIDKSFSASLNSFLATITPPHDMVLLSNQTEMYGVAFHAAPTPHKAISNYELPHRPISNALRFNT